MAEHSTDALILRSTPRGDNDRLLTLLSADRGRFYVIVKGVHSTRREAAATEPYTLINLETYEKGGVKWLKTATAIEPFPGIRYDMQKLFLAAYLADVAAELSDEGEPAGDILSLTLNALWLLSFTKTDHALIKAAFEMRAAADAGFCPELSGCATCGCDIRDGMYLDVMNGALVCHDCLNRAAALTAIPEFTELGERTVLVPLTAGAAAALCYVTTAPQKRIYAFRLDGEETREAFSRAAEAYLLHHLERGFQTLENYKKMQTELPAVPMPKKAADGQQDDKREP